MTNLNYGGYMGLTRPYETIWQNGRKVLIYPNGKIVDQLSGLMVRKGEGYNEFENTQDVNITNPISKLTKRDLIISTSAIILSLLIFRHGRK